VVQSRTTARMDPMGPSELENAWYSPAARGPEVLSPKKNLRFEARDSNARSTEGARTVEVRDSPLMSAECPNMAFRNA